MLFTARNWFVVKVTQTPIRVIEKARELQLIEFYEVFNFLGADETLDSIFQRTYDVYNGTFFIHDGDAYYQTHLASA